MTGLRTDLVVRRHGRPAGTDTPTLLFLHGLTDSGEGWPEAVAHWQDDYSIVTVDLRGHGGSPRFTADQLRDRDPERLGYQLQLVAFHGCCPS